MNAISIQRIRSPRVPVIIARMERRVRWFGEMVSACAKAVSLLKIARVPLVGGLMVGFTITTVEAVAAFFI